MCGEIVTCASTLSTVWLVLEVFLCGEYDDCLVAWFVWETIVGFVLALFRVFLEFC